MPVDEARAANRLGAEATVDASRRSRWRGSRRSRSPGPAGADPGPLLRPRAPAGRRAGAAARLLPRRRLGDRRPRHPRRRLPLPRRGGGHRGALGRLPARPRASLPGRRRRRLGGLRLGRRQRRRAGRRPGPDRRRRRQRRRQPGRRGQPAGPRRRRADAGDAAADLPGHRLGRRHALAASCSPRGSC